MKSLHLRLFTPWWMALIALLLASCGSDNNPVSPAAATVNQVTALNSTVPDNLFSATLVGSDEVPPNNSSATGTSVVVIDPASMAMKATIVTADITGTSAHIHAGATGVAGPIVFPLTETATGSGIWTTSATLTADQLNVLKEGNYYVNVHSSAFPDGEIRGQLLAQIPASGPAVSSTASKTGASTSAAATGTNAATTSTGAIYGMNGTAGTTGSNAASAIAGTASATASANRPLFYTNLLSGALVVPANTSNATAVGLSVFRPLDKSLTSVVISNGITGTGANIRQAAAGSNGPLVTSMSESSAGSGIWTSKATLTDPQIQTLQADSLYYEILSAAFPAGELRGQIVKNQGIKKTAAMATATTAPTATGITTGATTPAVTGTTTGATTPVAAGGATGTETGTTTGTGTGISGAVLGTSTVPALTTVPTPTLPSTTVLTPATTFTPITTLSGSGTTVPTTTTATTGTPLITP